MHSDRPLVLDVDGTFLKTDLLFESFWAGLGRDPLRVLKLCLARYRAPARLKAGLTDFVPLRTDLMPVNPEVAALAQEALAQGREVCLASASDVRLVAQVAQDYGLSARVFGSAGVTNLKGEEKARALVEAFGEQGFDYAGNEPVDMAIWRHAATAIVVGDVKGADSLGTLGVPVVSLPSEPGRRALWKAIRPHQWVKNILLFLPMIAAHSFHLSTMWLAIFGIIAFSAAASSIYVVNDLLDLEADRLHPKKCRRPFAAGLVPIRTGMATGVALALIALGVGAALGVLFLAVLVLYMALSLAYSLVLKRMRWIDIACLAALYTLRVVAGAAACRVDVSIYMLIFVFPVFAALGCVKRLTELTLAKDDARLPGRGYARTDRGDILNAAWVSVAGALVIFALYSVSDQGRALYPSTWILWVAMVPMAWWLIRMVLLGWYGKQDYDPIVFALKDKLGLGLLMIVLSLMFWAAGLWARWFGG